VCRKLEKSRVYQKEINYNDVSEKVNHQFEIFLWLLHFNREIIVDGFKTQLERKSKPGWSGMAIEK